MHIYLTPAAPLTDRLRAYADFLDERLAHGESLLDEAKSNGDWAWHDRLKTERAELTVVRLVFYRIFEREL